jgi:hypothetical protein
VTRRAVVIAVLAVLGVLTGILAAGSASAQTPAPTTTTTTAAPTDPGAEPDPGSILPDMMYRDGLTHPPSHYDLGWKSSAVEVGFGPIHQKVGPAFSPIGLLMALGYAVSNYEVQIGCRITSWSLNMGDTLTNIMAQPVDVIGRALSVTLIGGLQLRWLVLALTGIAVLSTAARGDLGAAGGQFGMAFLLLVAAGATMVNPGGLYRDSVGLGRSLAVLVMDATANRTPREGDQLGDAYFGALQRTLVQQPYETLNWGGPQTGRCAEVVDGILRDGPWGDSDEPRQRMRDAGCGKAADFNASVSWQRLIGVGVLGMVTFTVSLGMIFFSLAVLVAMLALSLSWAVAPVALTLGAAPQWRGIATSWAAGTAGRILKIPLYAGITGGFLTAVGSLAAAPQDGPHGISMAGRWLFLFLFVVAFALALWKAHKLQDVITQLVRDQRSARPMGHRLQAQVNAFNSTMVARERLVKSRTAARASSPARAAVRARATGLFTRVAAGRP